MFVNKFLSEIKEILEEIDKEAISNLIQVVKS